MTPGQMSFGGALSPRGALRPISPVQVPSCDFSPHARAQQVVMKGLQEAEHLVRAVRRATTRARAASHAVRALIARSRSPRRCRGSRRAPRPRPRGGREGDAGDDGDPPHSATASSSPSTSGGRS